MDRRSQKEPAPDSRIGSMKIEDFVQTGRLEAGDLNRILGGASVRIPLKMGTGACGIVEAKFLDRGKVELSWTAMSSRARQTIDFKRVGPRGSIVFVRCSRCREFRKKLYFTMQPASNVRNGSAAYSFACEQCLDALGGEQNLGPRRKTAPRWRR
jgi:hypothetical protein